MARYGPSFRALWNRVAEPHLFAYVSIHQEATGE
jgi:hypothetical protein